MKKILIFFILCPILVFSQGEVKTQINWIPLEKAKKYSKKYNKNIFVYFYKEHCPYCETMKKETLSDPAVIKMINNNFFAVKIDSRTKDTINYNGIKYSNQQPISDGSTWRHDFYAEVAEYREMVTTPTIVLFNNKFEKIAVFPGNHPKELLIRRLKNFVK